MSVLEDLGIQDLAGAGELRNMWSWNRYYDIEEYTVFQIKCKSYNFEPAYYFMTIVPYEICNYF